MYVLQVINDQTLGYKHPIIAEKNPVKNFVYYNNPAFEHQIYVILTRRLLQHFNILHH